MIDENITKVLELLKSESEFEESKNGDKGHVIWSNKFYKLSLAIVKLLNKHIVINSRLSKLEKENQLLKVILAMKAAEEI